MDHQVSEIQELLGQASRDFFAREYPMDRMRDIYRTEEGFDPGIWSGMLELGWTAAPFPESLGGTGGGLLDVALLLEEMGKACAVSPYHHSTIASGLPLVRAAPDLAAAIADGEAVVIPALYSDGEGQSPRAVGSSNGAVMLSGIAGAVPWANLATHLLLPLAEDERMAVVPVADEGVSCERLPTSGGDPLFEVRFDGAVGEAVSADGLQADVVAHGAVASALLLLGLCERSLELASDYAKQRRAFGKLIGAFQAISHKCANMVVDIEVGRYLVYKAAWLQATGQPFERAARYAKAYMGDATARVTRDAIQVHGGVGHSDDHPVQLSYRIGIGLTTSYGTAHEHRRAIADAIIER